MKKVVFILQEENFIERLKPLTERLRREGILWECVQSDESAHGSTISQTFPPQEEGALYLTQQGDCLQTVEYALESPWDIETDYLEKIYRRQQDLPWEILKTERYLVREFTPEDAEALWEIYKEPAMSRYTEGLHESLEAERAYLEDYKQQMYGFYEFGIWAIVERTTGKLIGRAGFYMEEDSETPYLGYAIAVPEQRKGAAYEVCSGILKYGFEELAFEKIYAKVHADNVASLALCRKLGMEPLYTEKSWKYVQKIRNVH